MWNVNRRRIDQYSAGQIPSCRCERRHRRDKNQKNQLLKVRSVRRPPVQSEADKGSNVGISPVVQRQAEKPGSDADTTGDPPATVDRPIGSDGPIADSVIDEPPVTASAADHTVEASSALPQEQVEPHAPAGRILLPQNRFVSLKSRDRPKG